MKAVSCPDCESTTTTFAGRRYCEQCGWKLEKARAHLAPGIAILICFPVILVVSGAVILGVVMWLGGPLEAVYALIGTVAGVLGWWYLRHRKVVAHFAELAERFAGRAERAPKPIADDERERYVWLLRMQPPRPIRMRIGARVQLVLNAGFFIAVLWFAGRELFAAWRTSALWRDALLNYLVQFLVVLGLLFAFLRWPRALQRERSLLVQGTVTLARITSIEPGTDGDSSIVEFDFRDQSGQIRHGKGRDRGDHPAEGAVVPVFYDPDDPARHIALSGSSYEILPH